MCIRDSLYSKIRQYCTESTKDIVWPLPENLEKAQQVEEEGETNDDKRQCYDDYGESVKAKLLTPGSKNKIIKKSSYIH